MSADVGCPEAESALLGAAMLAPERAAGTLAGLTAEDFTDPRHRDVHAAIVALVDADVPPDPTLVLGELRRAGTLPSTADRGPGNLLYALVESCPAAASGDYYRRLVIEHTFRRVARDAFERIDQAAESGSLGAVQTVAAAGFAAVGAALARLSEGAL